MFHTPDAAEAEYSATISLDLATVVPSVAGPKRPQDRVLLPEVGASFLQQLPVAAWAECESVGAPDGALGG